MPSSTNANRLSVCVRCGCLSLLVIAWAGTASAGASPRAWLERMVNSSGQSNFRGTLVHMCAGKVDVVSIVHRVENGRVTERVTAIDADGREIIRTPDEMMCIMPDQQIVMVGPRDSMSQHSDALLAPTPSFATVNSAHYRLQMLGQERVAGHVTEVIAIRPTDNFRFGYRLWLDRERAMPLKYELMAEDGKALEQTLFTEIQFSDRISEADVKPTIAMENFVWQRGERENPVDVVNTASRAESFTASAWRAAEVPPGFELVAVESQIRDNGEKTEHLVYSDGLASVSVFIEADVAEAERQPGASEMGALNAYTSMVDGFLVTAVGDVPTRTVRLIALSVEAPPAVR